MKAPNQQQRQQQGEEETAPPLCLFEAMTGRITRVVFDNKNRNNNNNIGKMIFAVGSSTGQIGVKTLTSEFISSTLSDYRQDQQQGGGCKNKKTARRKFDFLFHFLRDEEEEEKEQQEPWFVKEHAFKIQDLVFLHSNTTQLIVAAEEPLPVCGFKASSSSSFGVSRVKFFNVETGKENKERRLLPLNQYTSSIRLGNITSLSLNEEETKLFILTSTAKIFIVDLSYSSSSSSNYTHRSVTAVDSFNKDPIIALSLGLVPKCNDRFVLIGSDRGHLHLVEIEQHEQEDRENITVKSSTEVNCVRGLHGQSLERIYFFPNPIVAKKNNNAADENDDNDLTENLVYTIGRDKKVCIFSFVEAALATTTSSASASSTSTTTTTPEKQMSLAYTATCSLFHLKGNVTDCFPFRNGELLCVSSAEGSFRFFNLKEQLGKVNSPQGEETESGKLYLNESFTPFQTGRYDILHAASSADERFVVTGCRFISSENDDEEEGEGGGKEEENEKNKKKKKKKQSMRAEYAVALMSSPLFEFKYLKRRCILQIRSFGKSKLSVAMSEIFFLSFRVALFL